MEVWRGHRVMRAEQLRQLLPELAGVPDAELHGKRALLQEGRGFVFVQVHRTGRNRFVVRPASKPRLSWGRPRDS